MRVKFGKGEQRKFLDLVLEKTLAPSLRSLSQFGVNVNYSTLKNYYNEDRTLPLNLFQSLCLLSKIDSKEIKHSILKETWGKSLGGKISRRRK